MNGYRVEEAEQMRYNFDTTQRRWKTNRVKVRRIRVGRLDDFPGVLLGVGGRLKRNMIDVRRMREYGVTYEPV
ncbi:hypothetical protein L1887_05881 [Cichorium endivia]|nr:hypothetical protein L1887_05881 [Cichorium endivia]